MRKIAYTFVTFLLLLLVVGCGGGMETAVPDQPTDAIEKDSQTVAARPQLIEFYADW